MPQLKLILIAVVLHTVLAGCAYYVNSTKFPNPSQDPTPFIVDDDNICAQFRGKDGCCNTFTSQVQKSSYGKIDTVFGNSAGGCDICGVNLKRFWCEYSCSPRQTQFMEVGDYITIINPQDPSKMVTVQNITLYVYSPTACALFDSCNRTSYASQVSAMQTPAGFISFQGTNAIDDGVQTIKVLFTSDKSKGLYVDDLDPCDLAVEGDTVHGFPVAGNCSCNSCKGRCAGKQPYQPTSPLYGFDWLTVTVVWGVTIVISVVYTLCRRKHPE